MLRQRQLRKQIRDKKKTSLITKFELEDTLLEADRIFHGKLLTARRGTREQLDTIITTEEPPDIRALHIEHIIFCLDQGKKKP